MNEVWELVDINENKTGIMIERGTNTPIPQCIKHIVNVANNSFKIFNIMEC